MPGNSPMASQFDFAQNINGFSEPDRVGTLVHCRFVSTNKIIVASGGHDASVTVGNR